MEEEAKHEKLFSRSVRAHHHPCGVVHDPRILWPDTLSVVGDGFLYFTANRLHRQARYNGGKDLR